MTVPRHVAKSAFLRIISDEEFRSVENALKCIAECVENVRDDELYRCGKCLDGLRNPLRHEVMKALLCLSVFEIVYMTAPVDLDTILLSFRPWADTRQVLQCLKKLRKLGLVKQEGDKYTLGPRALELARRNVS